MPVATILRDTREQKPYEFEAYPVGLEDATLSTGDYTIAEFCDHDDNDTYHPQFAIERKTGSDFLNSITSDRERFKCEIKRAEEWGGPLEVVVEEPWTTFTHNLAPMKHRNIKPKHVKGTVSEWTRWYNVNFVFAGNRISGEKHTFETLIGWLRSSLTDQ